MIQKTLLWLELVRSTCVLVWICKLAYFKLKFYESMLRECDFVTIEYPDSGDF